MTTLIIYDSQFGNTEKIAKAIENGITGDVKLRRAGAVTMTDRQSFDLLIVGSPTQGGRPTPAILQLLNAIPASRLSGVKVAAFDTRFAEKEVNLALRLLMKTIGYAAPKIAKILESKGGQLITPAEGFVVTGKEGPLKDGEFERATSWGNRIENI
jgi:flavodoxin I